MTVGWVLSNPPGTDRVGAAKLVVDDPPKPPGDDGWTPAHVKHVVSQDPQGFLPSAIKFATNGVHEKPGQRLSTAQIDELAPMYAETFKVDEDVVRSALNQVYLYVGGPSTGGMAITIGTHVFMPTADKLDQILSPNDKRWLAHELTHTMQFAVYSHSSIYTSISAYMRSLVLGINPNNAGTGKGPIVWGAAFTGLRMLHKPNEDVGTSALAPIHRLEFSVLPALALGIPLTLAGAGALGAVRTGISRHAPSEVKALNVLGRASSMRTGASLIALPLLLGATSGMFSDVIGHRNSRALGAVGGAAAAAGILAHYGAFSGGAKPGMSKLIAAGGIALGGMIGYLSATATANTITGWSNSGEVLRGHYSATHEADTFADKMHDGDWTEIDAETVARNYVNNPDKEWDASKYKGKLPSKPNRGGDRLDWGLWNPLIVGAPLALGLGAGVLTARVGKTLVTDSLTKGKGIGGALEAAFKILGDRHRGPVGSLAVGAAATMAPMAIGGTVAGLADALGTSDTTSRMAGTAAAALGAGALLTMLVGRPGGSIIQRTPYVLAGAAIGGVLGYVAANAAVHAAHPPERSYDVPNKR